MLISHWKTTYKLIYGIILLLILTSGCKPDILNVNHEDILYSDSLFVSAEKLAGTNLAMATIYLDKALKNSDANSRAVKARYHFVKGRILYYNDAYSNSIRHLDSALTFYESSGSLQRLSKTYMFRAQSSACLGNYPAAINDCLQAMEINQQLNNPMSLASNYLFVGKLYLEETDTAKAFAYYDQARKITEQNPSSLKHANVLSSIGMLYKENGKIDLAEKYIQQAHKIQIKCANIRHIAFTTIHLAEINIIKNKIDKAFNYLQEVEPIYIQLNERLGLVNVYQTYALAFRKSGNSDNAIYYALKAYNLAKEIKSAGLIAKTSLQLSELYEQKGAYNEALFYHQTYSRYEDELISNEKNRLIKNLETNYEIQQKTNANKILTQQNIIKQQQLTLVSFFGIAVIIILLGILVFFRLKNQNLRHKQKLLSKRKEMADAKVKLHEKENLILQRDLELKNRELAGKTVELLRQNETLQALSMKMERIENSSCKKEINKIILELQLNVKNNAWNEFYVAFNNVHKDFYQKLFKICPDLSSTEIKIAALLKLNLSTKEIASLSYKSESAVKTARSRLRSKLNLKQNDNLLNFLLKI